MRLPLGAKAVSICTPVSGRLVMCWKESGGDCSYGRTVLVARYDDFVWIVVGWICVSIVRTRIDKIYLRFYLTGSELFQYLSKI